MRSKFIFQTVLLVSLLAGSARGFAQSNLCEPLAGKIGRDSVESRLEVSLKIGLGWIVWGQTDWPKIDASEPELYAKNLFSGLVSGADRFRLSGVALIQTLVDCPNLMSRLGDLLESLYDAERSVRSEFISKVRRNGYRVSRGIGTARLLTPNGSQSWGILANMPDEYDAYEIDTSVFKTRKFVQDAEVAILSAWTEMFRKAAEIATVDQWELIYDQFALSLKKNSSRASVSEILSSLNQIEPELNTPGLKRAALRFISANFDTALFRTELEKFRSIEFITAISSENEFENLYILRENVCDLPSLKQMLDRIQTLEELLIAVKYHDASNRNMIMSSKFFKVEDLISKDHWILKIDLMDFYKSILRRIRDCHDKYALLKTLNEAYEASEVMVDPKFYLSLVREGRAAYLYEHLREGERR